MPLHPARITSRERILAFGGANAGKSYPIYNIALRALKTGSDAKVYVIDTDVSVGRMLENPDFAALFDTDGNLINIEWDDVDDWEQLNQSIDKFTRKMRVQDWLCVDMVSPTWQWCQDDFTNSVFHKNMGDYFMQKRTAMKEGAKELKAFDGWKDWTVINARNIEFQNKILRCPGHVYCTAEVKALNRDSAEKDTAAIFGPYGVMPAGQKRMPHIFHTNLWFQEIRPDHRVVTTVKDRSRVKLEGAEVRDFSVQYLVKCGGWKLS